jgi:uncharacterized protein YecT (DUF1311 family)
MPCLDAQDSSPADSSSPSQPKKEIVFVSPSGAFEIESVPPDSTATDDEVMEDLWIVSTKDRTQRARLPKQAPDSPVDDEFHFSPNEEWLFGLRHVGSGLRYGNIYHLHSPLRVEAVGAPRSLNDVVWEHGVKLGAMKRDYSVDGVYAMTAFAGWSFDSSRLLIQLRGGEEKRDMRSGFLYFNTRTKKFETTAYSRKLGQAKSPLLACAEPVDALPGEAELKKRFDELDQRLNTKYADVLKQAESDRVSLVREAQRQWLKERDAGERVYLALFPAAERPVRRLQFLGDVTAARIDTPAEQWQ